MSFPKIAHIITDLNGFGGTEITLLRYLKESGIPREFHKVIVLKSIGDGDTIGAQIVAAGISVLALEQKRGSMSLGALLRLHRELKSYDPDVISAWLYHPSLLSSVLARFLKRRPKVIWHIRSLPFARLKKAPGRFVVQRLLAVLSRFSRPVIVSNSNAAMRQHVSIGFSGGADRWTIVHNGLDTGRYFPLREDRIVVRRELGIPDHALLIGCVGRFVPEKGYQVMFDALRTALPKLKPETAAGIYFLAIGNGVTPENTVFANMALSSLPSDKLCMLGKRSDVPRLLRALDIFVLPSISEAFPNSLVEAMATGLACVATDVGECSEVLPSADLIARPADAFQLAECMVKLIEMSEQDRAMLGNENRQRIVEHFTLKRMVQRFDALFEDAAVC